MPLSVQQAKELLAFVFEINAEFQKRLSAGTFPPKSQKGEYPRLRTGNLRSGLGWRPMSPEQVASTGSVTMGYEARAFYGAILEVKHGRLGLLKVAQDMLAAKGQKLGKDLAVVIRRV